MKKRFTLDEIAHKAMLEKGFEPDFGKPIEQELESISHAALPESQIKDLRHFLWVSIDNEDSRDLDQLTYAEENRIYVAIADVDALVKIGTAIDARASNNTTSVYTPTKVFPMLPLKLSTNLTSLNPNTDRCAIVVEMKIGEGGRFELIDVYAALVHNHAKLDYTCVGALLEHSICKHAIPPLHGLREQLFLQDKIAEQIQEYRNREGALEFGIVQLQTIIVEGIPVALEERGKNKAHRLIENYMIAANVCATRFLKNQKLPTIRRIVKTPKRWDRIVTLAKEYGETLPLKPDPKALRQFLLAQQKSAPLQFPDLSLAIIKLLGRGEYVLSVPGKLVSGHFDLAEHEYTHATAPNRRFPDLIMQRLLKSNLHKTKNAYSNDQLAKLAAHCTQKEDDAAKVERRLMKCAAAFVLEKDVGRTFRAMVTGAAPKGTWVRLVSPAVEGKLTKGFENVDVGDYIEVKLTHVDVINGHIDFSRTGGK